MAHYAFLDENNMVTEVIVGADEEDLPDGVSSWEEHYSNFRGQRCLRTSYNTYAGVHILGGTPFRGNFAGIGMFYDENLDAFIDVQPFPSWSLNESTFTWQAPIEQPQMPPIVFWNEEAGNWEPVSEA